MDCTYCIWKCFWLRLAKYLSVFLLAIPVVYGIGLLAGPFVLRHPLPAPTYLATRSLLPLLPGILFLSLAAALTGVLGVLWVWFADELANSLQRQWGGEP